MTQAPATQSAIKRAEDHIARYCAPDDTYSARVGSTMVTTDLMGRPVADDRLIAAIHFDRKASV